MCIMMNPRERSKQTKGKNRAEVLEPVFGDPKRSQLKILSVPPISPWLGRAAGPGGGSGVTRRHEGNTAFRHPALRFQITCHRWQGDVSNEGIQSERITAEMWKWPCEETRSNGNCQCTHACADGGRLLELPRGPQSHSLHSAERTLLPCSGHLSAGETNHTKFGCVSHALRLGSWARLCRFFTQ